MPADRSLRSIIKGLSQDNRPLTNALLVRLLLQSARLSRQLRHQSGGRDGRAMFERIRARRRSDTAFILGSGGSVNTYTDAMWSHIARHDSIAITSWILHAFVPDVFVFESDRLQENNDIFFSNFNKRWADYRDVALCWKDPGRAVKAHTGTLLPKPADQLFVPWMIELPDNYELILKHYPLTIGLIRRVFRRRFVMQKRATVAYCIDIAIQAGFKSIVLCGVDLRSTKYFWEPEARPNRIVSGVVLPPTQQEGRSVHSTMDPAVNRVTIDRVIQHFDEYYVKRMGAKLYVAADTSALHPMIDVYPWEERLRR